MTDLRHSLQDDITVHAVDQELALGQPRFASAELQLLASREGSLAAWHSLVEGLSDDETLAAVASVQGQYAVAICRPDGAWLLAVDRFATQSLCWAERGGRLRLATRADDLARALNGGQPDLAEQLDPQALFDYLFHHVIPAPRTAFKGVQRLVAGHAITWRAGQAVRPRRYWQPAFAPQAQPNFNALRDQFRQTLRDAVAERIPEGQRPVCFLSGGTDSSTVAGMAREASGQGALAYSIGFDSEGYDESEYARIAARHFDCEHREYYLDVHDLVRGIPSVAAHYDQPFGNSSAVPAFYCARLAKLDGAQHILAGDGGDELFGGNTRYAKEQVFELWWQLPQGLREPLLRPLLDNPLTRALPLFKKGASYVRQARVPMPDRMQSYNLLDRLGLQEVLTPAFLASVNTDGPRQGQRATWQELGDAMAPLNRMLAFDWRYTLAETDVPKVVGTTALAGLPVGFPLLDDRLLQLSLTLPLDYKLRGSKLRWFFKEALRGFLPDEILVKKKHGFGLPFGPWTLRHADLQQLAGDSLKALAARGVVRQDFIHTLLNEKLPAHPGYYGEMVWILMMLEQWLRRHAPSFRL